MMMIEITIINSSSVKPACPTVLRLLRACLKLPVTVLLSIQCRRFRLRADVENVFTAPRTGVGRVVTRTQLPISFSRHRIDRQRPQINLLLGGCLAQLRRGYVRISETRIETTRHDVHAGNQGFEVGRIMIRIIYAEDGAVANHDSAAWIDDHRSRRRAPTAPCSAANAADAASTNSTGASHAHRV